ncbi:MAG: DUF6644 family protein [Acidobacteriota bacterium]
MDIDGILKSIEGWSLATAIRNGLYSFPMLESIHVIGLAVVFGTILIVDLRLMGVASISRPFQRMAPEILKWTWVGFAITLITGALMFTTNATVYFHNTYFRIKMLLLLLAGVNMGIFELTTGKRAQQWGQEASTPPAARTAARLSLLIWVGVIITGRLIGFTTSRAAAPPPPSDINFDDFLK